MAKLYKTVMNRLDTKKEKDMLLNAQRAWIKYKETHCTALANQYEGGVPREIQYKNLYKEGELQL